MRMGSQDETYVIFHIYNRTVTSSRTPVESLYLNLKRVKKGGCPGAPGKQGESTWRSVTSTTPELSPSSTYRLLESRTTRNWAVHENRERQTLRTTFIQNILDCPVSTFVSLSVSGSYWISYTKCPYKKDSWIRSRHRIYYKVKYVCHFKIIKVTYPLIYFNVVNKWLTKKKIFS